jgi:histidyl-tRNA synthetase
MAEKASTKPASGTRDFLPAELRRREFVIGVIRRVYEGYGFEPLETPAFENIETLLGRYGEEGNKLIFKILRRGEHESTGQADLALRYDLTVPLARVVAQYQNELPPFFKRYQIQPVWRADRPGRGRFREFFQCDIDTIGSTSSIVEAEQIGAVSEVLMTLGFSDFTIRLNHREALRSLLDNFGMPADALMSLDKLDKVGPDGVVRDLAGRGVAEDKAHAFVQWFVGETAAQGVLKAESSKERANDLWLKRLVEIGADVRPLEALLALSASTQASGRILVDPSLARGLSYYTGAIMEAAVEGIGSLGGGGRYDNLVGTFLGRDVPACGFSLGLERIIVVMTERHMFPESVAQGPADVLVSMWKDGQVDALALASELRQGALRVDVYPEEDKLGKQLKYAASRQIRFVAIVGDDERSRREVNIKDLMTSHQESVPMAEAVNYIRLRLASQNQENAGTLEP